jgi:hypothetical protein
MHGDVVVPHPTLINIVEVISGYKTSTDVLGNQLKHLSISIKGKSL